MASDSLAIVTALRNRLVRRVLRIACRTVPYPHLERVGSTYGGWVIPTDRLRRGDVCYCAGSGEDISFDLELATRFSCEVYSIDPTPRALRYVARLAAGVATLHPVPLGLWSSTTRMRFYAPRDKEHVSHSIVNL